ncbi:HigA family addiction module antidote protein [Pseudomonas amygdali pv. morsprunorum]|nr:HigA family addiction module antidote protein [Pseudomonas amygdali pv. morsprunorum]
MIKSTNIEIASHPGLYVKSMLVDDLGLSVTLAAQALGVTRPALSRLLNQHAHLSADMALRIEKAFGTSMEFLMQMQNNFDVFQARQREDRIKVSPFKGKTPSMQDGRA